MKLILASNNKHKLIEFDRILRPLGFEIISLADNNIDIEIEETGETFLENSIIKAKAIFDITKLPTIADDSGIEVDYLNKEPGIFSARYGGEGLNDVDRYELILKNLDGVEKEKRTARYVCAICMILENGEQLHIIETCEGSIAFEPSGDGGFGYDPIFLYEGKSFSSISAQQKDLVSHRGKALRMLSHKLKEKINADK